MLFLIICEVEMDNILGVEKNFLGISWTDLCFFVWHLGQQLLNPRWQCWEGGLYKGLSHFSLDDWLDVFFRSCVSELAETLMAEIKQATM